MIRRFYLTLLLVLPALICTSCIEGEEEIWINPDGSGHFVAHYDFPSAALTQLGAPLDFEKALKMIDAKEDGVQITNLAFTQKGRRVTFHLEAKFKEGLEIINIASRNKDLFFEVTGCDPDKIDGLAGAIGFELKGLTPTFERIVHPSEIFPPLISKRPKMLGPATFKYIIHLPAKIKETNAHEVSDDGKTVSWTFLLKDHFEAPMEMAFTTQLPIPWWGWAILALVTFLLAWLLWRFVIRRFV